MKLPKKVEKIREHSDLVNSTLLYDVDWDASREKKLVGIIESFDQVPKEVWERRMIIARAIDGLKLVRKEMKDAQKLRGGFYFATTIDVISKNIRTLSEEAKHLDYMTEFISHHRKHRQSKVFDKRWEGWGNEPNWQDRVKSYKEDVKECIKEHLDNKPKKSR